MKEEKSKMNMLVYEKWWTLVGSWAEILPVAEGIKRTCIGE